MRGKCGDCRWFSNGGEWHYCIASPDHETHECGKEFIQQDRITRHEHGINYIVKADDQCHSLKEWGWDFSPFNR